MTDQEHSGIGDNIYYGGTVFQTTIDKHPSILAEVINELGSRSFLADETDTAVPDDVNIALKIEYNHIIRYKDVIEEHKVYQGKLNAIYGELDAQGSEKKVVLLRNIRNYYLKTKGECIARSNHVGDPITTIRANSDQIIEDIENKLLREIARSNNIREPLEVVQVGLTIVLVDAFMRCKILEEPKRK